MAKVKTIDTPVETPVAEEAKVVKPVKKAVKKGVVANCELLNVREAANTSSSVVKIIPASTEVEILGEEGDFYKVKDGYVMKNYIK